MDWLHIYMGRWKGNDMTWGCFVCQTCYLLHLQAPFRNVNLTPLQQAYNTSMSQVRVTVEWLFGDIVNWFKFIDFKKNLKIFLSPIGKMYITCALLTNARTCLYGNQTSIFFDCEPPTLENYFVWSTKNVFFTNNIFGNGDALISGKFAISSLS